MKGGENSTQMQAPTRTFHGYYIIPCFSEKCCTNLQSADEVDQQPKKSFTIESLLSRPSCSTAPTKNQEFSTSSFPVTNKHLVLSSRLALPPLARVRTHPYRPTLDLKQPRLAATYRAIVADSQSQIPRRHLSYKDEKPKRIRTVFTPEQLDRLEKEFDQQQYMVGTERFYLASELGLTETQVKVWFQNRRIKWRRQNIEAADGASDMTGE